MEKKLQEFLGIIDQLSLEELNTLTKIVDVLKEKKLIKLMLDINNNKKENKN